MRFIVLACAAGALAIPGFVAAAPAAAPVTTHAGSFVNIGSHTGKGTASVRRGDRNRKLVLSRNFATDRRVIKLHMYLATDPTGTTFVDLGPMKRTGAQTFTIPARIKLSRFRHAIVWCVTADVPITRARLLPVG